jgi:hypothetical protein
MAGFGFANPELQKARMLAQLNGSTAIPQNVPAIGKAGQAAPTAMPQTPNPQVAVPPQPQAPAPAGPAPIPMPAMDPREQIARMGQPGAPAQPGQPGAPEDPAKRDPKWYEVAGALGHIVLSIDAGLRNQPMPDPPGGNPRQQQDQEMQVQEFIFNTAARAWEAMSKAPPEKRGEMLKQFKEIIAKVDPSFNLETFIEGMMDDSDWADQVAPQIAVMSDDAKSMFMARVRTIGGDPATAAAQVVKDREFMDSLQAFEDQRNTSVLKFKLQKVRAAMVSMNMDPNTFAGMTPEEFARVNNLLPESVRLTPSELATLQRQPELGGVIGWDPSPREESPTPSGGGAPSLDGTAGYAPPPRRAPTRPAPGPAVAPTEAPAADATGRPSPSPGASAPPPRTMQRPQTRQPQQPAPGAPRSPAPAPSSTGRPAAAPKPAKPAQAPYYPPGWNPRTPKPRAEPAPVTKVDAVGKRPQKPATPAPDAGKPPRERRVRATKDTTVPGIGKVRKGDVIIYNEDTGEYRRG